MDVENRKRFFRIALANKGLNITQFAVTLNTSPSAVTLVLQGKSTSPRIDKAIDEFIKTELNALGITAPKN